MLKAVFTAQDAAAPSSGILQLQGSATVEFCAELRTALLDALDKTESLVVDVGEITKIDVSGLQLLCSARRSALQRRKNLVLADQVSEVFSAAVFDAGFNRTHTASCRLTAGQSCLWDHCDPAARQVRS